MRTLRAMMATVDTWALLHEDGPCLFDFRKNPSETYASRRLEFETALVGWTANTLNDPLLGFSSSTSVFLSGEDFLHLVGMGPAVVPYMVETLSKRRFTDFSYNDVLHYALRGSWQNVMGIQNLPPSTWCRPGQLGLSVTWWRHAGRNCAEVWVVRRAALDERLKRGPIEKGKLVAATDEPEWWGLRAMGLLGVPSIIERIERGQADWYDLLLMSWWIRPFDVQRRVCPFDIDKRVVPYVELPRLVPETIRDGDYWLAWWEENKQDYWWLLEEQE